MTELASEARTMSVRDRLADIAQRVGETVAGPAASEVDLNARFPCEAIDALRREQVLSALVPVELGGMGASLTDLSDAVRILSRHCGAAGCVLAMHTVEMFLLLTHGTTPALRRLVGEIVDEQLLIANANSEVGLGGDVTRSIAALVPEGDGWRFEKHALAASYARSADLISSTIKPTADAAATDQAVAIFRAGDFTLERTSEWDTLGLRGTCSSSLRMSGHVTADNLYPVPFSELGNRGGGQLRHVLLPAVWVGLAEGAIEEAHQTVRAQARKRIGTMPQSAMRLAEIMAEVQAARSTLAEALRETEAAIVADDLEDIGLLMSLRNVKVVTTTTAVHAATAALQICGISGFKRGHRVERIIRDAHGGLIMVGNDRYLLENAQMLPVRRRV